MERPKLNPFTKQHHNLTEKMIIMKNDPVLAEQLQAEAKYLDAEDERKAKTRSVSEFNELDKAGKVAFIQSGGIVAG